MIDILQNPELVATAVTLLLGIIDALRRYRKDETLRLHELPLVEIRAVFEAIRKRLCTISKPDHESFIAKDYDVSRLTRELGKQGVKPGHTFSYVYDGEVFNGIMYFYDPDRDLPHRQIHVRAFPHVDGLELMCHEEPHWYHHPVAHVRSKDMQFEPAIEWTKRRLENAVPVGYPGD
ncbi:hypothetical protein [Natrinema sp. H-ect4]|uniref:hypothetical protein n=1 Tax=Natrinema sp. H-ect4 TaxID=3242699 RepID=UPI0035A906E0